WRLPPPVGWVSVHPEITPPSNFHHLRDTTTLVSAIPLYVSVLEGWLTQGRSVVDRRSRGIAVFLSLLLFGSVVVLLTGIAYFVSALQSSS
ncbi:hypothetical protein, partial [Palleronia pelagia]|uniref:hypothetical protein n=1 Tax=Palleronia pelagia TaxID=387096 RepID=UPI001BE0F213